MFSSSRRSNPFRSAEELFFWRMVSSLAELIPEFNGMRVVGSSYEPLSLRISQVVYTPDFMVKFLSEERNALVIALFEIKASKKQKGYSETRAKLVQSAALFPEFVFLEAMVNARESRFESFEFIEPKPLVYVSYLDDRR